MLPRDDVQAGGEGGEEKNLLFLSGIELRFSGWASQSDLYIYIYIKVKQPHYRPGVAQRVPAS